MSAPAIDTDWLAGASAPAANPGGRPAKDYAARGNRKFECPECGFMARCSARAIERAGGLPRCACGGQTILPNLRDRAAVEWDALEAELVSYGRDAYDAAMRELGYAGMVEPRTRPAGSGLVQRRCEASGCHKFSAGRFCSEHEHERPAMAPERRRAA
jgi:hypothetical protein